jgi:hypothetical protein
MSAQQPSRLDHCYLAQGGPAMPTIILPEGMQLRGPEKILWVQRAGCDIVSVTKDPDGGRYA